MAFRAKEDVIDRTRCLHEIRRVCGTQLSPLHGMVYDFVTKTANLAVDMYRSRNDADFILYLHTDLRDHQAETLWAGTLFSLAAPFGSITYDSVAEITNPEVADYLQFVQPDSKKPIFQAIPCLLSELGQCNSAQNHGPILSLIASTFSIVDYLGKQLTPVQSKLGSNAINAAIWGLHYSIEQFNRASVGRWSEYMMALLSDATQTVKDWPKTPQFPTVAYKRAVDWHLDMVVPHFNRLGLYDEA